MIRILCKLLILTFLTCSIVAGQSPPNEDLGNDGSLDNPSCANTESQSPSLNEYNTYVNYITVDNISESTNSVNNWWVQGRIYLTAPSKQIGVVDHSTTSYVEPIDGTTPIEGGHAFTWTWAILVTVDQNQGLIIQSPFGSFIQNIPYIESDLAYVRITVDDYMIHYWLGPDMVYSQVAIGISTRDLRALYIGTVDSALIGHTTYSPQTWHFESCHESNGSLCRVYEPCE